MNRHFDKIGILGGVGLGTTHSFKSLSGDDLIIIENDVVVMNNTEFSNEEILVAYNEVKKRPVIEPIKMIIERMPEPYFETYMPQKSDSQPWARRCKHRKGNNFR